MTSKARGLADLGNAFNDGALSNRNLIINGAMQVAQRGTSFTDISTGTYYLDRWRAGVNLDDGSVNLEQSSDAPDGFGSSMKLTVATAETTVDTANQVNFSQRIEGQNLQCLKKGSASAESVTLSFWVKCSLTGTFTAELYDNDNTRHIANTYTVNTTNTWEKKTITFVGDTTGSMGNDANRSLDVRFWTQTGPTYNSGSLATSWASYSGVNVAEDTGMPALLETTNATWQITGVQLEVGDTATPFEHRSYGQELALCQRYYERVPVNGGATFAPFAIGVATQATQLRGVFEYKQIKRIDSPTLVTSAASDFLVDWSTGGIACTSVGIDRITSAVASISFNVSGGLSANQCSRVIQNFNANTLLAFDAEL